MTLTLRFVCILAAAAVLIGFSGRFPPLAAAGFSLVVIDVALAALDWRLLGRRRLIVARGCDDKLSLGARNLVRLTVRNPCGVRVSGRVRDEYPEGFGCDANEQPIHLPPRSEQYLGYHVTPRRRGDFEFGDIYVRIDGPLGLVTRQIRYAARRQVKVYPNLLDIRRYEIELRRGRLLPAGARAARVRGRGTDFESLRDYVPDDEFRAVDWKATARRGKLTTRQYQEEKSQNIAVVLDCGRVMGPVIADLTRLDHSINAAVMLARVAAQKGDKVGLMAFAEDVLAYLPPRAGKSQVLNVLRLTYNLREASGDSDYSRAVRLLGRKWTRRSLMVFFTDLVHPDSSAPLITQIAGLARKHLCLVVSVCDPAVLHAARGPFGSADDVFRAAAARQVLGARKQAAARLARFGVMVLQVPPDRLASSVVDEYLNLKSRGLL